MIKYQQHWSRCLWMFSPFPRLWQRADGRGHHWQLKETWQTAVDCLRDRTCQFRNFITGSQFSWLKCKTHMTTRVPSKHPILYRPWRCSPAYNQSSCESSSHIDGTELPPCVRIYWSVQTKWFLTLGKCLWKGMKEPSVSPWTTSSWQVLTSAKSFWLFQRAQNFAFNSSAPLSTLSMR